MSLQLKREYVDAGITVFAAVDHTMSGGFTLVTTGLAVGSTIPAGAMLIADEMTRKATVVPSASVVTTAAGSPTSYQVAKGSLFAVGKYLAKTTGGAAYPITAIDTTASTNYDVITVGTTVGAVTAGDALYLSTATGASAAAYGGTVNGLNYRNTVVGTDDTVSVITHGVVLERRIPGVPADVQAALKFIRFSKTR